MPDQPGTRIDLAGPRTIRVFISSTFRDMRADRDRLVKFAFPELRRTCESRGVTWGEVDLRWGVTDEEAAEGRVLPLCLEEIRRCRPYFIALLGERYGWVPQVIPPDLIEAQPWLGEHLDRSVTELEIAHGVLGEEAMRGRAFFYFRDAGYLNHLPPGEDRVDFESESPEARHKLDRLKQRIRAARDDGICRVREGYRDPEELGCWILEDFTRLVDELFPRNQLPTPLDQEAADHETFAHSRASVYVARPAYFNQLDAHAASDGPPLVVIGESGSGKSALLTNWFLRWRGAHPEEFAVVHFLGGAQDSTDPVRILRRIMLEIRRRFAVEQEVPLEREAARDAFPKWLARTGRECCLLVLDGLDQAERLDVAASMSWLPETFPSNWRVVVSTVGGESLDALRRRGWKEVAVQPLGIDERHELLERFLAQFGRRLSQSRVDRICCAPQTANPLFLRSMLDELRQFGQHEQLGARIERYLAAEDPAALFGLIVQRWEDDFGAEVVTPTLSAISVARRGLSEAELLDLLGDGRTPLPRARWTPLLLAAESTLIQRDGRLAFFHDYLRLAVDARYLSTGDARSSVHARLADYFRRLADPEGQRTWAGRFPVAFSELPYHALMAGRGDEADSILTDLSFVRAMHGLRLVDELLRDYELADRLPAAGGAAGTARADFARFVSGCAHWLSNAPHLVYQEAYNAKNRPDVCRAARALFDAGDFPPGTWLRKTRGDVRPKQSGQVISMTFWSGDRYLAVSTEGRDVWIWDTVENTLWRRLESPPSAAKSLVVSPAGEYLAAGFGAADPDPFESGILVWKREGPLLRRYQATAFIYHVRWLDDWTIVAGGGMPRGAEAAGAVWQVRLDASVCQTVGTYFAERPIVLTWAGITRRQPAMLAVSKDGRIFAARADEETRWVLAGELRSPPGTDSFGFRRTVDAVSATGLAALAHPGLGVDLYDVSSAEVRRSARAVGSHAKEVQGLCLAVDGESRTLAVGSSDGRAWTITPAGKFASVPVHQGHAPVTALCFSAGGSRLAVGDSRGQVFVYLAGDRRRVFDTERNPAPLIVRFVHEQCCALFPDRLEIAGGDDLAQHTVVLLPEDRVPLDFDVAEPLAVVLSLPIEGGRLRWAELHVLVVDLPTRRVLLDVPVHVPWSELGGAQTLMTPSAVCRIRLSFDAEQVRLILGSSQGLVVYPFLAFDAGQSFVRVQEAVDLEGRGQTIRLSPNTPPQSCETFEPLPKRAAVWCSYRDTTGTSHEEGDVRVWDLVRHSLSDPQPFSHSVTAMAPSGDGLVIIGTNDGLASSLRWDGQWHSLAATSHAAAVTATSSSGNRQLACTAWQDGRLLVWDVIRGTELLQTFIDIEPAAVGFVAGGRNLAVVDKNGDVHVWEILGQTGVGTPSERGVCPEDQLSQEADGSAGIRAYLATAEALVAVEDALRRGEHERAARALNALPACPGVNEIRAAWSGRLEHQRTCNEIPHRALDLLVKLRAHDPDLPGEPAGLDLRTLTELKAEFEGLLRSGQIRTARALAASLPATSNQILKVQRSWLNACLAGDFALAWEAMGQERYDQAIAYASRIGPDSALASQARNVASVAHMQRGTKAATEGRFDDAARDLRRARDLAADPEARAAIRKQEEAVELGVIGHRVQGAIERRDWPEAEQCVREALAHDSLEPDQRKVLIGHLSAVLNAQAADLAKQRTASAVQQALVKLEEAVALNPGNAVLAQNFAELRKFERALQESSERDIARRGQTGDRGRTHADVPGGRVDRVHFSVTGPPSVPQGAAFVVNVWAHLEAQREAVVARARETAGGAPGMVQTKGPTLLVRGIVLRINLKLEDLLVDPPEDTVLWDGEIGNATFPVRVPEQTRKGPRQGRATVYADGLQIARVDFVIQVASAEAAAASLAARETRHRTAFASYASEDAQQVAARIQGIQKGVPGIDIFWDRQSLRSGDRWQDAILQQIKTRDVFYLFWSRAASRSSWVDKEWRWALEHRGIDYIDPVPLASPDTVPPPPELGGTLHFNDWMLAFTRYAPQARSRGWWRFWH